MKKFFSLVLALVMALSLTTVAFGATTVTDLAGLQTALDAGETDVVVEGVVFDSNPFNGKYYVDRNIDFVGCTFTADMNWMYINNATFTNCTFNSTGAAVHYDEIKGDVVFNDCVFTAGKVQLGASGTLTFNNCEFADTASANIWSDNGIRVYSPAEFNDCEFNNRVVLAGANDLPTTFNACTMNDGTPVYYADNSDGIIRGGNVPFVGTDVTKDANGKYTGGTFSATPAADAIAPGYALVNGTVVNNAGQFNTLTGGTGVSAATGTWGATLDAALADKTYSAVMQDYAPAVPAVKSFPTFGLIVTHIENKTVNTYGPFVKVPSALNADCVYVSGGNIIYLDAVPTTNKYDDNATAVKVAVNSALYAKCDEVYVDNADEAGTYYLYKTEYYEEVTPAQAEKVFNVNGVVVYAAKTTKVNVQPHAYKIDLVKSNAPSAVLGKAVSKVYCSACGEIYDFVDGTVAEAVAKFGAGNYEDTGLAGVIGKIYVRTAATVVGGTVVTPSTDKVQSAETFDAGIAMYVGMSVMAAAGAVVLKKRED